MPEIETTNVVSLESYRHQNAPPPPRPWPQLAAEWCLDWARSQPEVDVLLSEREVQFLLAMETWPRPLSPYQKARLVDIITKIRPVADKLVAMKTPDSGPDVA